MSWRSRGLNIFNGSAKGTTAHPSPQTSSKQATRSRSEDYGLKLLAPGNEPTLDIVMVHGPNGHWEKTWTADNNVFWPRDLLPDIVPNARIFSYGYDARTYSFRSSSLSQQSINDHARTLVADLTLERERSTTERRPIIFVAHSIGGLLVKNVSKKINLVSGQTLELYLVKRARRCTRPNQPDLALIHSNSTRIDHLEKEKSIKLSTYGILFMGTPHQGGKGVSLGKIAVQAASIATYHTQAKIMKNLGEHSDWLQQQQIQFLGISGDFAIKFFYEIYKTPVLYGSVLVVPKYSAVSPTVDAQEIAMPGDHRTIVKYTSSNNEGFKKVSNNIFLMAKDASKKVDENWVRWERIKEAGAMATTEFNIDFRIDHARNGNFTGRADVLGRIHSELRGSDDAQSRIVALYGPGGIGKTQVTLEYVHRNHAAFSSVFFIDATSRDSVRHSFLQVARRLIRHHVRRCRDGTPDYSQIATTLGMIGLIDEKGHIQVGYSITDDVVEAMLDWFGKNQNRDWLLVFDNADDLESFDIVDFFPKQSWGSILITTRRPECARFGVGIELDEMTQDEGLLMLKKTAKYGPEISPEEQDSAIKLVEKLGCLPLAIEQAGAYICVRKLSFKQYLQLYNHDKKGMLNQKPPNAAWSYRNGTVFTTWEVSFSAISDESPESAELLLLCAWLANVDIWGDLLRRGLRLPENDATLQNHIQKLSSYSLLKYNSTCDTFSLHPLVHLWARERLSLKSQREKALKAVELMAMLLSKYYNHSYFDNPVVKLFDISLYSTGINFIDNTELSIKDHDSIAISSNIGLLLGTKRRFNEALKWYRKALVLQEKAMGADHSSTLQIVNEIGATLFREGQYDEALKWYGRALSGREKALGMNHFQTLDTVYNIGLSYVQQKRYNEALQWYKRALVSQDKALGADHLSTIKTAKGIGTIFFHQGQHDEALKWYKRALASREKALGMDHPQTLNIVYNIGISYTQQKRYDEALEWCRRALAGQEKALSVDHFLTLKTINEIGYIFFRQERYDNALEWYKRALAGREKTMGAGHPSTLETAHKIDLVMRKRELASMNKYYPKS